MGRSTRARGPIPHPETGGEMSTRTISTDKAPKAIGPYSQGIAASGFLFLSGQVPLDPRTGDLVQGTVREEATRVMENLKAVLEAAGSRLDRVVRTTAFLPDPKDFAAMDQGGAR